MKYFLKWSGMADNEVNRLMLAYCMKEIPICKDVCKIVNHAEYIALVEAKEIEVYDSTVTWRVAEGQLGLIGYTSYRGQYQMSWEHLDMCRRDFLAGYEAMAKIHKMYLDHEEAIVFNNRVIDYYSKKKRTAVIDITNCNMHWSELENASRRVTEKRNGKRELRSVYTCTGPEFEHEVWILCRDNGFPFPELEPNPLRKLQRKYVAVEASSKKLYKKARTVRN